MSLRVVFRVDASIHTGQGHVMRCLALAEQLRQRGALCRFISAAHPGNLISTVRNQGFAVEEIAPLDKSDWIGDAKATAAALGTEPTDWLVADHYGLDYQWEALLKKHTTHLMVIDDLADRCHDCDLLLDQNPGRLAEDYHRLINPHSQLLIGPEFALLRDEFAEQRKQPNPAGFDPVKKILISLGGTDPNNVTTHVLSVLESARIQSVAQITVILSSKAPWLEAVREQARQSSLLIEVIINPEHMSEILSGIDLAIGAAGVSALERCCIGLPSLLIITAENQRPGALALHALGAAHCLGDLDEYENRLRHLLQEPPPAAYWETISARAKELVDGEGCSRVAHIMSQIAAQPLRRSFIAAAVSSSTPGQLRSVLSGDLPMIFAWRNHPDVRRFMRHSSTLNWHEHLAWFKRRQIAGNSPFIFEIDRVPLGFVQFDKTDSEDCIEWGFYVAPDAPKGIGQRLGKAAISHIFKSTSIHRIIGRVLPGNLRSQRFHERLGFHRMPHLARSESKSDAALIGFSLSRSDWSTANAGSHGEFYEYLR